MLIKDLILVAGLCLISGCSSNVSSTDDSTQLPLWKLTSSIDLNMEEKQGRDRFNEFGYRLMSEACSISEDGEFCVSPVSVSIYLSMLANACVGECRDQIIDVLGVQDISVANSLSKKLMQYLPCDENGSSLGVYNRFWVTDKNTVPSDFIANVANWFNAGVEYTDFTKKTAVAAINGWVYDSTNGKIPQILERDWREYVDTKMINANTVYFKGDWEEKFQREKTTTEGFHTIDGEVEVEMMHNTLLAAYAENENLQSLLLGFEGNRNRLELYLPSEHTDIRAFLSDSCSMCEQLDGEYATCEVTLSLPSFSIDSDTQLMTILGNMGVVSLGNANLSPMGLGSLPLQLIHKTSLKIDEDGAELAAVTAGIGQTANSPEQYRKVELNFNRPFVYIIRNNVTDAILLAGAKTR